MFKIKLEEKTNEIIKEIPNQLNEWNEFNKRMLVVSNDSKRKEIRSQAIDLDTKIFNRLKELKEELMMNRNWIYRENKKVEKELIQFDG